jgi:hypothetical protein
MDFVQPSVLRAVPERAGPGNAGEPAGEWTGIFVERVEEDVINDRDKVVDEVLEE